MRVKTALRGWGGMQAWAICGYGPEGYGEISEKKRGGAE